MRLTVAFLLGLIIGLFVANTVHIQLQYDGKPYINIEVCPPTRVCCPAPC